MKPYRNRYTRITCRTKTGKTTPEIRLSGAWLQEYGFEPDEYVRVTASNELIVIERIDERTQSGQPYTAMVRNITEARRRAKGAS